LAQTVPRVPQIVCRGAERCIVTRRVPSEGLHGGRTDARSKARGNDDLDDVDRRPAFTGSRFSCSSSYTYSRCCSVRMPLQLVRCIAHPRDSSKRTRDVRIRR
jgi:hypothetical protein